MTAEQILDKLHKLLEFKQSAARTNLIYCEETYGKDSVEAENARTVWSELLIITQLIEHPERIDEHLNIWEETND